MTTNDKMWVYQKMSISKHGTINERSTISKNRKIVELLPSEANFSYLDWVLLLLSLSHQNK